MASAEPLHLRSFPGVCCHLCISPLAGLGNELDGGERRKDGHRRPSSLESLGGGLSLSEAETVHGLQVALPSSRVDGDSLDVWKFRVMPLARTGPWLFTVAYLTGSHLPRAVLPSPPPLTLPLSLSLLVFNFFLSVCFCFWSEMSLHF